MLLMHLLIGTALAAPAAAPFADYQHLVRTDTWVEQWPDAAGRAVARTVTAELWTAAMQAALDAHGALHVPSRALPYYLDGPLVLKSGQRLSADTTAELRLRPGCNTCMVRNAQVASFRNQPVPTDTPLDTDIRIEGGIWTTLANGVSTHGNELGRSSKDNPVFGTHGVILLQNVRRVVVKQLTVRQSRPFGVHLANAHEFTVENVTLDHTRRDGVHVNGPASDGVIRGVHGVSEDDVVALNAWEWKNYAPCYGPLERILVEDVSGAPAGVPAANSVRLLPGVKRFDDGATLDCPLRDITFRRITDIAEYKAYAQPNLELGRDRDASVGVGHMSNLRFEDLTFNRPGRLELHADTDGLVLERVQLNHPLSPGWHLLAIGPPSATYTHGSADTSRWVEIFAPDLDCTVRHVTISGVRARDSQAEVTAEQVVRVIQQQLNPDYPRTRPRGGTGKGVWLR